VLSILRFGGWYALTRFVHQRAGTALAVGIALVPLGEFNVVLANDSFLAHRLNMSEYGTAIGATLLSIVIAALAARIVAPRRAVLDAAATQYSQAGVAPVIIILGYGRVGRTVGALCKRAEIPFAVVELDVDAARRAQNEGVEVLYGDGADPSAVERLLLPQTRVVLTTIPESQTNAAIARRLSAHGNVRVVARAQRMRDVPMLRKAGASDVLVPEAEGAFGFAQAVLADMGLSEDRIDALVREHRAALAY